MGASLATVADSGTTASGPWTHMIEREEGEGRRMGPTAVTAMASPADPTRQRERAMVAGRRWPSRHRNRGWRQGLAGVRYTSDLDPWDMTQGGGRGLGSRTAALVRVAGHDGSRSDVGGTPELPQWRRTVETILETLSLPTN